MEELEKIDILSLTKEELTGQITAMGEKAFRAKQIYDWLHVKKVSDFSQMSNISAQFREELSRKFCLKHLIIKKKLVSALDNTVKYLYGLPLTARRSKQYLWNTSTATACVFPRRSAP